MEVRRQPPLFYVDDEPVYEVWFWHGELSRWFVMSTTYDAGLFRQGVVYFDSVDSLKAWIRALGGRPRAA